ncbi:hypothetical protein [Crocosphaera sp.]|nr:hypothetical protein [Crocosphaera sp.]MDJ0580946.1 hypothetical protein [Crocosphaera sp.]
MKISQEGINVIKNFEGCRLKTYADTGGVAKSSGLLRMFPE